jgi:hypothetical protein
LRFSLGAAGAPIQRFVSDASARNATPGINTEDGSSPRGDLKPVLTTFAASGAGWQDNTQEQSQPGSIAPLDHPDAHPATTCAFIVSEWLDDLTSMETAEATRGFAAFSVCLGVFLAWKSHQSTRSVARKANDPKWEAAC